MCGARARRRGVPPPPARKRARAPADESLVNEFRASTENIPTFDGLLHNNHSF
jgi:hypothetical protein